MANVGLSSLSLAWSSEVQTHSTFLVMSDVAVKHTVAFNTNTIILL